MFTASLALGLAILPQQAVQSEQFQRRISKTVSGQYLVSLPDEYNKDRRKRWPLILFLHGAGERGDDLEKVKVHGPIKEVLSGRKIPAIVVAPQCPEGQWWSVDTLTGLLETVERKYRVDKDRVYLTGLSMGGFGTWALAIDQPERFAAIAPICGGGERRLASRIKDIPTWVVHGDSDQAVPLSESQEMVSAVERAGGKPKFVIVKGGPHDVWTDFYADDAFYEWLFAQSRKK